MKCEGCPYRIEKEFSKSQFNLCWARIQDIADKLRVSKDYVYGICLKRYGQSQIYEADTEGLKTIRRAFKQVEVLKEDNGKYTVQAWKGIEYMDSKELSIFTDGVLQEWREMEC